MFPWYRAKEDCPPSWEKSPLAFFHTHLKHVSSAFKVLPSTIIKQSKPWCFSATFSSSSVGVSCGKAHMLAALRKIQDSPNSMQTSNWLEPQAAVWMACVQSVQSGRLVLWEVISSGSIFNFRELAHKPSI